MEDVEDPEMAGLNFVTLAKLDGKTALRLPENLLNTEPSSESGSKRPSLRIKNE